VALLNPLIARRFQETNLARTKTDALDATGLARLTSRTSWGNRQAAAWITSFSSRGSSTSTKGSCFTFFPYCSFAQ
jgi:transposase